MIDPWAILVLVLRERYSRGHHVRNVPYSTSDEIRFKFKRHRCKLAITCFGVSLDEEACFKDIRSQAVKSSASILRLVLLNLKEAQLSVKWMLEYAANRHWPFAHEAPKLHPTCDFTAGHVATRLPYS